MFLGFPKSAMREELCQLHINGQHTFFLNQNIISKYSERLKRETQQHRNNIEINDFPGGANGFELISRFCYNNGRIRMTPSNVSQLHTSAIYLEMTEHLSQCNLLYQTETFLEDSSGFLSKLIFSLIDKITQTPSSSSSASPEIITLSTPDSKNSKFSSGSSSKAWWFEDLTVLPPNIVEKMIKTMGYYGIENTSLVITRFLLYYLKVKASSFSTTKGDIFKYGGLADTVVYGSCRVELERLIGGVLEEATLDDLLVCNHNGVGVYDVDLVLRLVRVLVSDGVDVLRLKKVGRLFDKYLREISPDQTLKVCKFVTVAQCLPDWARDCFDGVYKAIDIYLESHPTLTMEERSRICRCLNYEKLSLEACKELAKNPRVPPRITVEALVAQQAKVQIKEIITAPESPSWSETDTDKFSEFSSEEKEEMKMNLQKMQCRVVELEKVCKQMKGQMSKLMVKDKVFSNLTNSRALPRLC
ncbi:hypothetical protein GIB67_035971 [Kingdonia uniflora]|uniref:NPH3 domain-containing protein n=1 Tax=Kingdonia uniflora TaxID=39325 RepID=A0A7J7N169_9MAGN|nr:hypothetical protein GIB67_035971 [Kingdonia uniflora]